MAPLYCLLLEIKSHEGDGRLLCTTFRLRDNIADPVPRYHSASWANAAVEKSSDVVAFGIGLSGQVTDAHGETVRSG